MHRLLFYLAALWLGAFHALEPGHGKTVVAAYLVGSKGSKIDAVFLGIVVTITHTLSIIILAIIAKVASVKWALSDQALHGYIGLVAGALILGVGLWMLVARLQGKEPLLFHSHEGRHSHDHSPLEGHGHFDDHNHGEANNPRSHDHDDGHSRDHNSIEGHGHSHDYSHAEAGNPRSRDHADSHSQRHEDGHDAYPVHVEAEGKVGYWQLFLLGISGGLVPCPAAMDLLLAGIASGRLGEALTLVLLFSFGLAAALVAIGLTVVSATSFASRFLDAKRFARKIAIVSAALITVIGLGTILGSIKHIITVVSS
jgi:nickel/cobalt exporter